MGFQVAWHIEQRVLLAVLQGEFSLADIGQMRQTIAELVMTGVAPVHVIVNMAAVQAHPTHIREIAPAPHYLPRDQVGWVILINPSRITQFVMALIGGIAHIKTKTVTSLEEALAVLQHVDATLPG